MLSVIMPAKGTAYSLCVVCQYIHHQIAGRIATSERVEWL